MGFSPLRLMESKMRIAVGVSLMVLGMISMVAATAFHFDAEAELLAKRPEFANGFYSWLVFRKHRLIEKLYRTEFPHGRRIRQFWMCAIAGMLAFCAAFVVLGFFK